MTHRMKLQKEPFDLMACGKKQYEFRLYDEKRRAVSVGDSVVFTCEDGASFEARVRAIITAPSWESLDLIIDPLKKGDGTPLCSMMRCYYSENDEKRLGCVALELEVVKGMI